jgi:hypothetical protein
MKPAQLEGIWLNGHIRELLDEQAAAASTTNTTDAEADAPENTVLTNGSATLTTSSPYAPDPTARALKDAISHAEKVVEAAKLALQSYLDFHNGFHNSNAHHNPIAAGKHDFSNLSGGERRGVTNREMSGEMGGDTVVV